MSGVYRRPPMEREVWIAPEEMRALRDSLGLTMEQAAARVSASCQGRHISPRAVQEALTNIEDGTECFVSRELNGAIRRGLGMRTLEASVIVQPRFLMSALRRAGLTVDDALDRCSRILTDEKNVAIAQETFRAASEMEDRAVPHTLPCSTGKGFSAALDQHADAKHRGTVRGQCAKCAGALSSLEDHVASCPQCLAHADWMEWQSSRRNNMKVPMSVAKALSGIVGEPIYRLSASTSTQRRQLYGVQAA